jgi:hypothetical protein
LDAGLGGQAPLYEKALGNAALLASPSSMPFAVQTEKSEAYFGEDG